MLRPLALLVFLGLLGLNAHAAPPKLFFSDMTDGATKGWEQSTTKGAAVSIWGLDWGASRGGSSVTVCGVTLDAAADFAEWGVTFAEDTGEPADDFVQARGLQRTTFYLNSSMSTGSSTITVTTSEGTSRSIPFHCRDTGKIYFVSTDGNDGNDGRYATNQGDGKGPFRTFRHVRPTDGLEAGDVAYVRAGIYDMEDSYPDEDKYSNCMMEFWGNNHNNGTANNSITVAAFPAELVQLGSSSSDADCVFKFGRSAESSWEYWTFSKFKMRTTGRPWHSQPSSTAPLSTDNLRLIGNDVSSYEDGSSPIIYGHAGGATNIYIYGNHLHDMGSPTRVNASPGKAYGLYLGGYGSYDGIHIGWNEIAHQLNGRGTQIFGHKSGDSIANVYYHDNFTHHNENQGLVLGGSDQPSSETFLESAWVYNNIFADNDDYDINLGDSSSGSDIVIYNNTFYSGTAHNIHVKAAQHSVLVKNNIFVIRDPTTYNYFYGAGYPANFSGSHNLYHGDGNGPSWDTHRLDEVDPQFVSSSPSSYQDFRLQPTSLAIDEGTVVSGASRDFDGVPRTVPDLGAFEGGGATGPLEPPGPPSNVQVD